jgi:hypothetical protein
MIGRHPCAAVLWDAATDAPALLQAAPDLVVQLDAIRNELPVAASVSPFETDEATRPYRHLRAFYLRCAFGVIAVKGTEPLARDVAPHLEMLDGFRIEYPGRGKSLFSALEHFPLTEHKIPLALTAEEALQDARAAASVQLAHLGRFKTLARVPLPLLAARWPDAVTEMHLAKLLPLLSGRAWRIVQQVADQGLGVVVYAYPTVPLRVAHLPHLLQDSPSADWLTKLQTLVQPKVVIEHWLDLLARLLVLGFLPGSIESIGVGHCLEIKNATIDGGLVDLGSVCQVEALGQARSFDETLLAAMADLVKTCRFLLRGDASDVEAEYRNPSLAMLLAAHRLLPDLGDRVRRLGGADPRIQAFFAPVPASRSLPEELARLSGEETTVRGHG